jgi:Flp pilus assembly pilin Flp
MTKLYAFVQSFVAQARELESGQTMAEYAVVLAVITIAILGALSFLAGGISSALSSVTSKL